MLKIGKNFDFEVVNRQFVKDETINTILISALFSDKRYGGRGGYWLPLRASELWRFKKAKKTRENLAEILLVVRETLKDLAQKGYFKSGEVTLPKVGEDYVVQIEITLNDGTKTEAVTFKI